MLLPFYVHVVVVRVQDIVSVSADHTFLAFTFVMAVGQKALKRFCIVDSLPSFKDALWK